MTPAGTVPEFSLLLGAARYSLVSSSPWTEEEKGKSPIRYLCLQEPVPSSWLLFIPFPFQPKSNTQNVICKMFTHWTKFSFWGYFFFSNSLYSFQNALSSSPISILVISIGIFGIGMLGVGPRCGCQRPKAYLVGGRLSRTFILFILDIVSINTAK